jgi:hypothetical protein
MKIIAVFFALCSTTLLSGHFIERPHIAHEIDVNTKVSIKISKDGQISYPPQRARPEPDACTRIVSIHSGTEIDQEWPAVTNQLYPCSFPEIDISEPPQYRTPQDGLFYAPPAIENINRFFIHAITEDKRLVAEARYWNSRAKITLYDYLSASIIQEMGPLPDEAGPLLTLAFYEDHSGLYLAAFGNGQTHIWKREAFMNVKSALTATPTPACEN